MRTQVAAVILPVIYYVFVYAIAAALLHVVVPTPVPLKRHYGLATLLAALAEVKRALLRLFAGLVVDELADGDPAAVADVRVVLVVAWCCLEGIAGWRYSVLVHSASLCGPCLRGVSSPAGAFLYLRVLSHRCIGKSRRLR